MDTFEDIFRNNRYNIKDTAKKSRDWFQQQVTSLTRQHIAPNRMIATNPDRNKTRIVPGELYLFHYDAKHQDILEYWDMYPLVFPFRKLPDGFIGLNMHYLPYQYRIRLLDHLMSFKTNKTLTENTKLKFQWSTIAGISKYKMAQPCVHRYLADYVQSPFKKVDAQDWATAMMLPVERFVGANKQKVWTNSLK